MEYIVNNQMSEEELNQNFQSVLVEVLDKWCKPMIDHESIGEDHKEIHLARIEEMQEIVKAYGEGHVDIANAFYYYFLVGCLGDIDDLHHFPNVSVSFEGLIFL